MYECGYVCLYAGAHFYQELTGCRSRGRKERKAKKYKTLYACLKVNELKISNDHIFMSVRKMSLTISMQAFI
jgi:hypothetical protein